eukprot:CAMPEP_0197273592 /NCGR_PEP_ID=MMETSP1432-20130617/11491_1 /TAXON_ID=44447 /ORGANISM="Pseudo-nitzschia delicatissima, Strain UNC1205" /LENGTH=137 /DNA_ID=CAMNT_0042739277 /DNA_START=161 /DNA_END=571 /DNA_ORIENTATION=+
MGDNGKPKGTHDEVGKVPRTPKDCPNRLIELWGSHQSFRHVFDSNISSKAQQAADDQNQKREGIFHQPQKVGRTDVRDDFINNLVGQVVGRLEGRPKLVGGRFHLAQISPATSDAELAAMLVDGGDESRGDLESTRG